MSGASTDKSKMETETPRQEALRLLTEFYSNSESLTKSQVDAIFLRLSEISPDPAISEYVFYPEGPELTPEEIVEKAFSYKPIAL